MVMSGQLYHYYLNVTLSNIKRIYLLMLTSYLLMLIQTMSFQGLCDTSSAHPLNKAQNTLIRWLCHMSLHTPPAPLQNWSPHESSSFNLRFVTGLRHLAVVNRHRYRRHVLRRSQLIETMSLNFQIRMLLLES